jgi:hypothetical protein
LQFSILDSFKNLTKEVSLVASMAEVVSNQLQSTAKCPQAEFLKLTTKSTRDGKRERFRQHTMQQRVKTTKGVVMKGHVPATNTNALH